MKQFLVIQLARFGDLIQSKRLIQSLAQRGEVHLCVDHSLQEVATLVYPQAIIHTIPAHKHLARAASGQEKCMDQIQLQELHSCFKDLQAIDFSLVYALNHSPITRALVRLFSSEKICGYAMYNNQAVHNVWIQKAFLWTQQRTLSPINIADFWAFFDYAPCNAQHLNPLAQAGGKGLGIVLAGRESRRSLPPPVLAAIIRIFFESNNGPDVYLFGSQAEMPLARQLKKYIPTQVLQKTKDLSGKTNWAQLFDAVQGLDMLISPDTGTMHLAAHLGVPIQAFFLSSAYCHETGPYGQGHKVWQSVYECAPCLESAPCHMKTQCLDDFNHKDFLRALTLIAQGKKEGLTLPPTLTLQESYIDTFGCAWKCILGEDVHVMERMQKRAVLAEYCGFALQDVLISAQSFQKFYNDSDAMLHFREANLRVLR